MSKSSRHMKHEKREFHKSLEKFAQQEIDGFNIIDTIDDPLDDQLDYDPYEPDYPDDYDDPYDDYDHDYDDLYYWDDMDDTFLAKLFPFQLGSHYRSDQKTYIYTENGFVNLLTGKIETVKNPEKIF